MKRMSDTAMCKAVLPVLCIFAACITLASFILASPAKAQPCFYTFCPFGECLPGLPCLKEKTENDPDDPRDGPNTFNPLDPFSAPNRKKSDSNACDADFMNQIFGRAQLHAARQVRMGTSLIRKPDSVLEYSCFDETAETALEIGHIFTESFRWGIPLFPSLTGPDPGADYIGVPFPILGTITGNFVDLRPILTNTHMGIQFYPALQSILMGWYLDPFNPDIVDAIPGGLISYYFWNFGHDYLGGYAVGQNNEVMGVSAFDVSDYTEILSYIFGEAFLPFVFPEILGIDLTSLFPSLDPHPGQYVCTEMARIFDYARCLDFGVDDKFFDFEDMVNMDIRRLPNECWAFSIPDPVAFLFPELLLQDNMRQEYIDIAKNKDYYYANFDEALTNPDVILNGTEPAFTGSTCLPPFPTGVNVTYTQSTQDAYGNTVNNTITYEEKVCPNPFCYYNRQTDLCTQTR